MFIHINMLRVLLKIDRVTIRIKEAVELHILIKKGQKYLTHCKRESLVNGQLNLHKSSEFFITPKSPVFDIEIFLVKGHLKKHGGVVSINLSHYPMNTSHQITAIIQKTPLANSTVELDFVYMLAKDLGGGQELVAQEELQSISHIAHLNQISKQNQYLLEEKDRLNKQIEILRHKNIELEGENRMIEESLETRKRERDRQARQMDEEKKEAFKTLELEKKRIAEIVDIINESANYDLIRQLETIINQHHDHEHSSMTE